MSHEFMGMEEDCATFSPRAFDTEAAVKILRARYRALLDVINGGGGLRAYKAAIPMFKDIAAEGRNYGVLFDTNPTVLIDVPRERAWLVSLASSGITMWMKSDVSFTSDPAKALRFARQEDAELFIAETLVRPVRSYCTPREYTWN